MKLFQKYKCDKACTVQKYFYYMKNVKDRMGNYINEGQLGQVYQIQDPECRIYGKQ